MISISIEGDGMVTKEVTKLSLNIIMIKFYKKCCRLSIV